jgi:hypothetical protein
MKSKAKFKLGLDIHGVADTYSPVYSLLSKLLVEAGHEVHVITGARWSKKTEKELKAAKITWTHFFSILEWHEQNDTEIWKDPNGYEWISGTEWDRTKAEYCKKEGITMHIDDSPLYALYFDNIPTLYLQQHPSLKTPKKAIKSVVGSKRKVGRRQS